MKNTQWIVLVGLAASIQFSAKGSDPVAAGSGTSGVHVAEWTCRGISVAIIKDMAAAGKIARKALDTDTVDSFVMGEASNADMNFFRELRTSGSVKRVVLTNIHANKIELTHVIGLFPNATDFSVYFAGKVDASFAELDKCEYLRIDGPISPRTLNSIVGLENLDSLLFFVDGSMQFADLEKIAGMKRIESVAVYPVLGFKIPGEWVKKLNENKRLKEIIDPDDSGWLPD